MNIAEEKEEIVKRIYEEDDLSVIHAIKDLLDATGCSTQSTHDIELEKELGIASHEADSGKGIPHEEVWSEIRKKYKL